MSRLAGAFTRGKALILYIMAGDPSLGTTEALVPLLAEAGADLVELGVPFTDPVADGPVIQRAAERALTAKTTLHGILETVTRIRRRTDVPLALMTYLNPVLRYGSERFARDAADAGVDGVLVPDLPPDEAGALRHACGAAGLDTVFFLAPTSPKARIRRVAKTSTGFIYYVSLIGITGTRLQDLAEVGRQVAEIRRATPLPVAVGFGIATPDEVRTVARLADGVIVGSALIRHLEQYGPDPTRLQAFVRSLKEAVRGA